MAGRTDKQTVKMYIYNTFKTGIKLHHLLTIMRFDTKVNDLVT